MKAEQGSLCQREKLKGKESERERLCEKGLWEVSEALLSRCSACEKTLKLMHVPNRYMTFLQARRHFCRRKGRILRLQAPTHCAVLFKSLFLINIFNVIVLLILVSFNDIYFSRYKWKIYLYMFVYVWSDSVCWCKSYSFYISLQKHFEVFFFLIIFFLKSINYCHDYIFSSSLHYYWQNQCRTPSKWITQLALSHTSYSHTRLERIDATLAVMVEETWNGDGGQHQMLCCIVGERINDRSAVERSSRGIVAFEEEWNITLGGIVAGLLQPESAVFRALAAVLKAREARDCKFL